MSRLSILNMAMGFLVLFFAACAGAFVSFDMTQAFLHDITQLETWEMTLLKSSHGHSNLFGILHIALGLTLPYSPLTLRWKAIQTACMFGGVLAMGPGMVLRAMSGPSESFDALGLSIGVGLTMALVSLGTHTAALFYKLLRRQSL
ncbi:MAG TPA: hypothetical protein VE954_11185 [Oligoflexus sp.]|uniref:hypothetical protein n=1 Tax=Oligoflexus sp. TaxID=1971216 RepID=UPI002D320172|nr:hypothetical protein [Oligoflexus sp.]HYX33669.1 hypothetical protein [Oligoflexus sp.]